MISVNSIIKRKDATDGGLIGGFFSFAAGGQVYGISCNHVIADLNRCNIGDPLTDENDNPVGTLSHWLILNSAIHNRAEFALFKPVSNYRCWKQTDQTFKPGGFAKADLNSTVIFVKGNVTTQGTVTDLKHSVAINWNNLEYQFTCVEVTAMPGTKCSVPGDSGGAVFIDDKLLGIILGISSDGSKTYIVPYIGGILAFVDLMIF